jgi:hypothetical protein
MLDEATLVRHLGTMGWDAKPHGTRTWKTVRAVEGGEVVVFVRLTDNWLIASIVPFLQTRGQNSFELCRWLLRQNRDMPQLKFGIDDDGDVVLTVEMPTESLDFGELKGALDGLVTHGVTHRATLRTAADAARGKTAGT